MYISAAKRAKRTNSITFYKPKIFCVRKKVKIIIVIMGTTFLDTYF